MSLPNVSSSTYLDMATYMAVQEMDQLLTSEEGNSTLSIKTDEPDFDTNPIDILRRTWSDRIERWNQFYNKEAHDYGTPLINLTLPVLFFQRPMVAIPLWNIMYIHHTLDRLVTSTMEQAKGDHLNWEYIPIFEYLDTERIKARWEQPLKNLRQAITEGNRVDPLLGRISKMWRGVVELERAVEEIQRSFQDNLKDKPMRDMMLKRIGDTVEQSFAMIDTYLTPDANHPNEFHGIRSLSTAAGPVTTSRLDNGNDLKRKKNPTHPAHQQGPIRSKRSRAK